MTRQQAVQLVAMLASYWRADMPNASAALWSEPMLDYELVDGRAAVERLGRSAQFMPSLAEFLFVVKQEKAARLREPTGRELPEHDGYLGLAEFLENHPEFRERLRKIGVSGEPEM